VTTGPAPGFGDLLRRYRLAAALTQEELAGRAGLSARAVSDLERSVKTRPRRDTVRLLADALGLDAAQRAALDAARGSGAPQAEWVGRREPVSLGETAPPLIGRTRELSALDRHLAGEGPPVLLLAGESGIGKSRLLREAVWRAAEAEWTVLEGGCQGRGGQDPYTPMLGALNRHLRQLTPERWRAGLRGCAWLVRLLPELAEGPIEPLPSWSVPPAQERRLLFEAVERYLANVAGAAGTLLVLDDLQWAGPDALDLLATLARGAAGWLRIVGAYRDTEARAGDPLSAMLGDLVQADLLTHCTIGPLHIEEARRLLAGQLEGTGATASSLLDRVLRRTGGVPFFVISYARAADPFLSEGADERIPWSLAQSIRQRVALLPGPAAEVLAVAALIGRVVPHQLLLRVAGPPEQEVFAVLEAAQRARLLQVEAGEYQFAHDLIREVLEDEVGAARRAALHRRIGEGLEQEPGEPPLDRLAYHFERAGDRGRAARYLELAGDRAQAQQAHTAAEEYYRVAAAVLEQLGRATDLARVRLRLGTVLTVRGNYEAALAALELAARALHEAGDGAELARALAQIGTVHSSWGTAATGLARLQPWLEPLESGGPTPGLAALYAVLSDLYYMCMSLDQAVEAAERSIALARALADERALSTAQIQRGQSLKEMGRLADARLALEEGIRLGEATTEWATLAFGYEALARLSFRSGDFAACRHAIDRAVEIAEQQGNPFQQVAMLGSRGLMALHWGDWAAARADLERSLRLSCEAGTLAISAFVPLKMALLCLARGEWAEAARLIDESMALPERDRHPFAAVVAQALLAELDLREGRSAAARDRIHTLPPHVYWGFWHEEVFAHGYGPLLALAHLELGEPETAEQVVAETIARARDEGAPLILSEALRVAALIGLRQGRRAETAAHLEEALGVARRLSHPYQEARLLQVCGVIEARDSRREAARTSLAEALLIFRRLGASKDIAETERLLTALD
jgi:tetratricopeptide (TPR) repeat protein/transcriptional regulator with XRE-family HTH domain